MYKENSIFDFINQVIIILNKSYTLEVLKVDLHLLFWDASVFLFCCNDI